MMIKIVLDKAQREVFEAFDIEAFKPYILIVGDKERFEFEIIPGKGLEFQRALDSEVYYRGLDDNDDPTDLGRAMYRLQDHIISQISSQVANAD